MRTAASPPRHLGALPHSARGSGGGRGVLDAALVRQLAHLRGPPEPRAPARRTRLLRRAAGRWPARPGVLLAYHDLLLFLVAYPDERAVLRLAEAELRRIAAAVVRRSPAEVTRLDGTGLPGTLTACAFSLDLARWLTRRFPRDVELDWEQARGEPATRELARLCVAPVERAGIPDGPWDPRRWFELARGRSRQSALAWALGHLDRFPIRGEAMDRLYDSFKIFVSRRLRAPAASRTLCRFPPRRPFLHRTLLRDTAAARRAWSRALPAPRRITSRDAAALIDVARVSLGVRHRETDPVTYASARDVTLFSLERGIDVALFGMLPERRLPLESYVGYLAAKNRVPIAYGGAWIFLDRARIGVNVLEGFRGGESAYVFAQVLRVYAGHFGVRRFFVDPFQLGHGNREGIESGAFWFYYRLGFRPLSQRLARLAEAECRRLQRGRPGRSSPAMLRRLARSPLRLDLDPRAGPDEAPDPLDVSRAVTRLVGRDWRGDRQAAEAWARGRAAERLGIRPGSWPGPEREAFGRLSLVVAFLPGLAGWSPRKKRALAEAMRAKGKPRERGFVTRTRAHRPLRAALARLARLGALDVAGSAARNQVRAEDQRVSPDSHHEDRLAPLAAVSVRDARVGRRWDREL